MRNFTQIPNKILDAFIPGELTELEMRICCELYRHYDRQNPIRNVSPLANKLNLPTNVGHIYDALRKLRRKGLIKWWKKKRGQIEYELLGKDYEIENIPPEEMGISGDPPLPEEYEQQAPGLDEDEAYESPDQQIQRDCEEISKSPEHESREEPLDFVERCIYDAENELKKLRRIHGALNDNDPLEKERRAEIERGIKKVEERIEELKNPTEELPF
jgi:hypothetical protein